MEDRMLEHNQKGEELFRAGDYRGAEKAFLQALSIDPHDIEACNNLGVIAFLQRETEQALNYFDRALELDPFYQDALLNLCDVLRSQHRLHEAVPYLQAVLNRYPQRRQIQDLLQEAGGAESKQRSRPDRLPWKLYYSPGIAGHGENVRRMLGLEHYIPALHGQDPVWFMGMYFQGDYLQAAAHQGRKIINWRGSDALQIREHPQSVQWLQTVQALHVCQSVRQQSLLAEFHVPSIVRPMLNTPKESVILTPFPQGRTEILVLWRNGIDHFIQADLFMSIVRHCPDVVFHIIGDEDRNRFKQPGLSNLAYHGWLEDNEVDRLMDRCKGTLRPWLSDGTPNIQSRMLLKGRYAAHHCRFEKVAQCATLADYVRWIERLKQTDQPDLETRQWWLDHLNRFDFLEADFDPDQERLAALVEVSSH